MVTEPQDVFVCVGGGERERREESERESVCELFLFVTGLVIKSCNKNT